MECADGGRRLRRPPASRGRAAHPRHEQPRRVQQPRPPAPAGRRGDPRAGRAAVLRDECLGRDAARRAGGSACSSCPASTAAACSSRWAAPTPTSTPSRSRARRCGKPRGVVVTRDRSYHGSTHLAMALSGDTRTRAYGRPRRVRRQPRRRRRTPTAVRSAARAPRTAASARPRQSPSGSTSSARERVAAVIMEPNAGSNGIVAPDTYWPALRGATARARHSADRRRGDERLRPLRRVVRLAAPRRSRRAPT